MTQTLHRKRRNSKPPSTAWRTAIAVFLGIVIVGAVVLLVHSLISNKSITSSPVPATAETLQIDSSAETTVQRKVPKAVTTEEALDDALYLALARLGAPKRTLRIKNAGKIEGLNKDLVEIRAEISTAFPMSMANHQIQSSWRLAGGEIIDCVENKLGWQVTIQAGFGGIATRRIILNRKQVEPLTGKVCLIIDDFGALPFRDVREFLRLKIPFTASVMPFEEYTEEVYKSLSEAEIEIIVHMPMEPEGYPRVDPGENAIFVKLPPKEIKKRIELAIAKLPRAVGMNNHMGSRATADKPTMVAVAEALANSGLFFIDSRTSVYTVAEDEMRKHGVPVSSQDGNIDVEDDSTAIAKRFLELALASRETENGMLIVGHARPNTIIAIKRVLPTLEKWGIEFVSTSEIVAHRRKGD